MNPYYKPYWTEDEDILEHFGILGMKWGVRRFQNKDGTLTKAGKQRYSELYREKASKDTRTPTKIKGQSYDQDIRFPAGSVGYRVSGKEKFDEDRPLYLSYDKSDHVQYIATAIGHPDYGIASDSYIPGEGVKALYSIELKAKEPIKAPSYQHAMETFVEMIDSEGVAKINPYSPQCIAGKNFLDSIGGKTLSEIGPETAYRNFVDTLRRPDRKEFFDKFSKKLEEKGYNALVDPEDKQYEEDDYNFYKAPMLILDPKKTVAVSKTTKLTGKELKYFHNYDMGFGEVDRIDEYLEKGYRKFDSEEMKIHKKWRKWYDS